MYPDFGAMEVPDPRPKRTVSCSTLLRGSSFLAEQRDANKKMTYDDIVYVSKLQSLKLYCMHAV